MTGYWSNEVMLYWFACVILLSVLLSRGVCVLYIYAPSLPIQAIIAMGGLSIFKVYIAL